MHILVFISNIQGMLSTNGSKKTGKKDSILANK